jgi:hypothetical protein
MLGVRLDRIGRVVCSDGHVAGGLGVAGVLAEFRVARAGEQVVDVPGVALEARQVAVILGVGDELGVPQQFVGLRA